MEQLIYEGFLKLFDYGYGESDDNLTLDTLDDEPLANILKDEIAGEQVTVRYFLLDKKMTKEEANEELIKKICGYADVDFGARYSEYTGYLWTDEDIKIGGHDLLEELKNNVGKYLILIIDVL